MTRADIKWGAVIAALGGWTAGVAEGARQLLTGDDVKDGSLDAKDLSRKARAALKGNRGLRGPQGVQGATGAAGAAGRDGTNGTNGSIGPSGNSLLGISGSVAGNGLFLGLFQSGNNVSGTETDVQFPVPAGMSRVTGMSVHLPNTSDLTFTLRVNAANTTITCGTQTAATCTSTGSVTVAPGNLLSIGITGTTKTSSPVAVLSFGL